jgi:hypothetical protein
VKPGAPVVAALAAALALPSLFNGFVYDDVLVILQNPLVHGLSHSGELWHASYWPAGLLYRPLTSQLFALQWALGAGSPLVFHAVSILLAAVTAGLVFRLCSRLLPPPAALLAALLFAVHPVHVEVVANVVGQAELLAAICALLAVERYLAWSAEGELSPLRRRCCSRQRSSRWSGRGASARATCMSCRALRSWLACCCGWLCWAAWPAKIRPRSSGE